MKILMVCLGNICRSPMAEGVMRQKAEEYGLPIEVDSAGFEEFHVGDHPDPRAVITMKNRGCDIYSLRARLFTYQDFSTFDKIYVMDTYNYQDVISMAKTQGDRDKVDFLLNLVYPGENRSIKDPYQGNIKGFEEVYEQVDRACELICSNLQNKE